MDIGHIFQGIMDIGPIMQGIIGNIIFKGIEISSSKIFLEDDLETQLKECVQTAVDKLSTKYPVSKSINGQTFWDLASDRIKENISTNSVSEKEIKIIFKESLLNAYSDDVDIKEICEMFYYLLKVQIINYPKLLGLLLLNYCTSFNIEFDEVKSSLEMLINVCSSIDSDYNNGIERLIHQQPQIWEDILSNYSKEILNELRGEVDDFSYPISNNFTIPRTITNSIHNLVINNPLVTLIGGPLSGKTNVVYQLCNHRKSNLVPLYIDAATSYGVFEKISNKFNQETLKEITAEKIKYMIMNSFSTNTNSRFVIIIDNLSLPMNDSIWKEIYQLIDINNNNKFSILLVMDEYCFNCVSKLSGRPTKSPIGKSCVERISYLSDKEFEDAQQEFYRKLGTNFHNGAQYNNEYRNPRLLRLLAAKQKKMGELLEKKVDMVSYIPSITTFDILNSVWECFLTDIEMQTDMRKYVEAFIEDQKARNIDANLTIISFGRGTITLETAELMLGNERMNRLIQEGFIQRFNLEGGRAYILPRFPEALSASAAFFMSQSLINMYRADMQKEAYQYLKTITPYFPYGDLVAAMAIYKAYIEEPNILTGIINNLLEDEPLINKEELKGQAYFEDLGKIKIENKNGTTISNWYPWLILSHIASVPIGDETGNRNIQLGIFAKVGAFKNILLRIDNMPFKEMRGYHVHSISEEYDFLCGKVGIVEPITFAMQRGFYEIPEEMLRLCKFAIEEKNVSLIMRLDTAASSTLTCMDEKVKSYSETSKKLTSEYIKQSAYDNILHTKVRERIRMKSKIGRNDPCPCNSGRKFKKCCGKY